MWQIASSSDAAEHDVKYIDSDCSLELDSRIPEALHGHPHLNGTGVEVSLREVLQHFCTAGRWDPIAGSASDYRSVQVRVN